MPAADATPLTAAQRRAFRTRGHVTVPAVFAPAAMDAAVADADAWGNQVLGRLDDAAKAWYLERHANVGQVLRKLDDPVFHRPLFRDLAGDPRLIALVESILGPGVAVAFSQIFLKPPGGGPKPAHQDNFYFGPTRPDGTLTAWIALDHATVHNGCLCFANGTHNGPVLPHTAPPDEPFNLQLPPHALTGRPMTPAPVPKGGVSLHHGNTFHRSAGNTSDQWRRAAAFHYVRHDTRFANPALPFDPSHIVTLT